MHRAASSCMMVSMRASASSASSYVGASTTPRKGSWLAQTMCASSSARSMTLADQSFCRCFYSGGPRLRRTTVAHAVSSVGVAARVAAARGVDFVAGFVDVVAWEAAFVVVARDVAGYVPV